jgi:hypothetical protein
MINFGSCGKAGTCAMLVWLLAGCGGPNGAGPSVAPADGGSAEGTAGQPVLSFENSSHDFGTVVEGERVVCYFEYVNSGGEPLVIQSVETSCGCTTLDWSSEPLPPGGKERLQVIFDATGRSGAQRKLVTVVSNATSPRIQLILKADVKDR